MKEDMLFRNSTQLGMGVMRFPTMNPVSKKIDRNLGYPIIDEAIKLGVNYFDTAYGYHQGDSEVFLGEALKDYKRSDYFIATKLPLWKIKSQDDVKRIFNEQLRRLQTDCVDVYLLHNWQGEERYLCIEKYKIIEFLDEMKQNGVIRKLGFSYHDVPEVLEKRLDSYQWDVVQLQINYVDWDLQRVKESCEILEKRNIPYIAMEPIRGGMLANLDKAILSKVNNVKPDLNMATLALRWVASQTNSKMILSGMSTLQQLRENAQLFAYDYRLTRCELGIIDQIKKDVLNSNQVLCTECNYCNSCAKKIDIPKFIKLYNRYLTGIGLAEFGLEYESLLYNSNGADKCISCNKCKEYCPQNIDVSLIMKEIKNLYRDYITFS